MRSLQPEELNLLKSMIARHVRIHPMLLAHRVEQATSYQDLATSLIFDRNTLDGYHRQPHVGQQRVNELCLVFKVFNDTLQQQGKPPFTACV